MVTARYAEVDALVAVGSASNVQKLFDLAQTDPARVFVDLPQSNVSSIQPDASAVVTVDEYPGETFDGKLARNAGAFNAASRTMTVEIDLPNPAGRLYVGMFAHGRFVGPDAQPVLVLADNTIVSASKGTQGISVDVAGKIAIKPVKLGVDYGTKTQSPRRLAAGDSLVQNPTDNLVSGLSVSGQPASSSSNL